MPIKPASLANLKGGSRKGIPNKSTASAKEAFQLAFQGVGGAPALTEWALENKTEFYKLFARLIPTEQHVSGAEGQPLGVVILPAVVTKNAGGDR